MAFGEAVRTRAERVEEARNKPHPPQRVIEGKRACCNAERNVEYEIGHQRDVLSVPRVLSRS